MDALHTVGAANTAMPLKATAAARTRKVDVSFMRMSVEDVFRYEGPAFESFIRV